MADSRRRKKRTDRSRAYGRGSVYYDPKVDAWYFQPPSQQGQKRPTRQRYETEQRALLAQEDYLRRQREGQDMEAAAASLSAWLMLWLTEYKANLAPTTRRFYRQMIQLYIIPAIGDARLEKLNADDLTRFFNHLREHLAPRSVRHVYTVLDQALRRAVKARKIPYNPMEAVDAPKVPRSTPKGFSLKEQGAILDAVHGHTLAPLYALTLLVGLRHAETIGLRWADYDRTQGVLRVTGQMRTEDGATKRVERTKSESSAREIPLPATMRDVLADHWQRQLEARRSLGTEWKEHGLMFPSEIGTPMNPRNLSRHWYELLTKAGIAARHREKGSRTITYTGLRKFHDLRHTAASNLDAVGASEAVVRAVLGHSAQNVTQHYTHADMTEVRAALERVMRERGGGEQRMKKAE